jgi:hypothetical protein
MKPKQIRNTDLFTIFLTAFGFSGRVRHEFSTMADGFKVLLSNP